MASSAIGTLNFLHLRNLNTNCASNDKEEYANRLETRYPSTRGTPRSAINSPCKDKRGSLTETAVLDSRIHFDPITYLLEGLVPGIPVLSELILRQLLRLLRERAFVVVLLGDPLDRSHLGRVARLVCKRRTRRGSGGSSD